MIHITERDSTLYIKSAVTDFIYCMEYCEHKIPFYRDGIIPPKHEESEARKTKGGNAHRKEEKKELETIKPITDEELIQILPNKNCDMEFIREHIFSKLTYELNIDNKNINLVLSGRPDKVLRQNEMLIVEEDKFPSNPIYYINKDRPFNNQLLQALIYLNSKFSKLKNKEENSNQTTIDIFFTSEKDPSKYYIPGKWFEIPHEKKKWVINIKNEDEKGISIIKKFEGIEDQTHKVYLENNLRRFIDLVLDKAQRFHHGNFKKCIPCEYAEICKFSLKPIT